MQLPVRPVREPGRLTIALVVAAGLALIVRVSLPSGLDVRTDIVGYPIHRNFDVYGLFRNYYAAAAVFPAAAVAIYVLLGWLGRRRGGRPREARPPRPMVPEEAPQPGPPGRRAAAGHLLFVGSVIGVEVALALRSDRFWTMVGAIAVAYALVVAGTGTVLRPGLAGRTAMARRAVVNAVAATAVIPLLYLVSRSARVTVVADGSVHRHPWLPLWLAVAAFALCLGVVGWALARARGDEELYAIERRAVFVLAGATGLFLVLARLPGAVGGLDFYHDGEHLAAAQLVGEGAFPWRDILFVHGFFEDVLHSGLGMLVFGNDVWGALAGLTVLLSPIYWVGLYLLYVRLFGRSWLFLVLTASLTLQGWLTPELNRLFLVPYFLLLLAALLRRATLGRAAAFVVVGLTSVIVTPESVFAVLAGGVAVVAFDAWYSPPGQALSRRFRRTLWCSAVGAVALAAWCAYLAANGALDSFVSSYLTFARDHELTGGIPVSGTGFDFWFAAVAPAAVAVGYLWWFGARLAARRPLQVADWVIAAVAASVLLYMRKFLSRADGHAFHVLGAALPLLHYALYRLVNAMEAAVAARRLGRRLMRATTVHPLTLTLVVLVVALTPGPALGDADQRIPGGWDVAVPEKQPGLGYSSPAALPPSLVDDMKVVLGEVLGPDDPLFDMTNSPALFHYLLGAEPATRYYHVSLAIRRSTQADLLDQLRRVRPKLVVLDGGYGMPNWDLIPGTVRHYDISEYVLHRYRPLAHVQSFTFMLRSDLPVPDLDRLSSRLSTPARTGDLLGESRPCEWGYAPEFLTDPSPAGRAAGPSLPFTVTPTGRGQDVAIALPSGIELTRFNRLEIEARESLRADEFTLSRSPGGNPFPISFKSSGEGGRRYRVRVGSCPQWYAFSDGPLVLHSGQRQDIVAVRLSR